MVKQGTAGRGQGAGGHPECSEGARIWRAALISVVAVLLLAQPLRAQFDAGIAVGSKAPAIVVDDLEGVPVDLGTVIGRKPMLIEFWATWCALCKGLLPELDRVHQAFGEKVAIVGVNVTVNDSKARVRRYLDQHHPPFQALWDNKGVGARAYEVPTTSFIVVVDGGGKVVYTGSGEKQDLVGAVRKAFRGPSE